MSDTPSLVTANITDMYAAALVTSALSVWNKRRWYTFLQGKSSAGIPTVSIVSRNIMIPVQGPLFALAHSWPTSSVLWSCESQHVKKRWTKKLATKSATGVGPGVGGLRQMISYHLTLSVDSRYCLLTPPSFLILSFWNEIRDTVTSSERSAPSKLNTRRFQQREAPRKRLS